MVNSNKSVMTAAYIKINGITKSKAMKPEVQEIISGALVKVWSYEGLYEGESEELREQRLDIDSAADGEPFDLASHFREIDPSLVTYTDWQIIFLMLNKLDKLQGKDAATDAEGAVGVEEPGQLSDTTNNNFNVKVEDTKMSNTQSKAFEELTAEINSESQATAKPKTASKAVQDATRKLLDSSRVTRQANTANTVFEKIILSKRSLAERLTAGEEATGTVANPEQALAKFVKKLGITVAEDGTITAAKLFPGEEERLQEVYDALKKAASDPTYALPVYIGGSMGTTKGGFVKKPDGKTAVLKNEEISKFIYNETMGAFNGPDGVVVYIATARGLEKPEKTLIEKKIAAKGADAVVTLKIANRKSMLENPALVSYYQDIDKKKTDTVTGAKSQLYVKYMTDNVASDGVTKKTATYRIPLMTEQYVTVVADKDIFEAWGEPKRAGNQVSYDLSNKEDLENLFDVVANVLNEMVVHNITGIDIVDEARANAANVEEADAKEANEAFDTV